MERDYKKKKKKKNTRTKKRERKAVWRRSKAAVSCANVFSLTGRNWLAYFLEFPAEANYPFTIRRSKAGQRSRHTRDLEFQATQVNVNGNRPFLLQMAASKGRHGLDPLVTCATKFANHL